mmetsp:Transcript_36622/g.59785  ORF Transcript_36622/g.59785 Transcript_36622/m.59785 type:complete len:96 (-) Transcript_36622:160-447(-)
MAFGEQTLLAQHHEDIPETNVVAPPTAALSKKAAVKESQEPRQRRPSQSHQMPSHMKQGSPKPHAPYHIIHCPPSAMLIIEQRPVHTNAMSDSKK